MVPSVVAEVVAELVAVVVAVVAAVVVAVVTGCKHLPGRTARAHQPHHPTCIPA